MRKLLLVTLLLLLTNIETSFALTDLPKNQADKFIQYFDNYYKAVINWNSCEKTVSKVLYQSLSFEMRKIENSNLYNIYAINSPVPFDDHGYTGDVFIENSPIVIENIFINTSDNFWVNICDILEFNCNTCSYNFTFNFPELKSKKSISFNDFAFVASSKNDGEIYIKMEKRDGNLNEFWFKKTIPKKKVKNKSGKYITSGGGYILSFIKLDCENRVYDSLKYIVYDDNGNVVKTYDKQIFEDKIVPNTALDIVRDYICE